MEKLMRVIIGCEFSQIVTMEFRNRGHEAFSCDILPTEGNHPEWHFQEDILEILKREKFDLGIFHPPCTYLSYAGTMYWGASGRCRKRLDALEFFRMLWEAPIDKICIENPKGCASPTIAKYTQEIQPYYFGDEEMKTTWLWLKNLPPLKYSKENNLFEIQTATEKPEPKYKDVSGKLRYFTDSIGHSKKQAHIRSKTFPGIARAMAEQWG
jgi:hypothetical protein